MELVDEAVGRDGPGPREPRHELRSLSMPTSGRNIISLARGSRLFVHRVGSSVGGSPARWREIVAPEGRARRRPRARRQSDSDAHTEGEQTERRRFIGGADRIASPRVATVVIDIETVGRSWDSLDDAQRTYLEKNARTDEERAEAARDALALAAHGPDHRRRDAQSGHGPRPDLVREDRRPRSRRRRRTDASRSSATRSRSSSPSSGRRCALPPLRDVQRARIRRTFPHAPERGARDPRSRAISSATATPSGRTPICSTRSRSSAPRGSGTSTSRAKPSASRAPRNTAWTAFPSARTTGRPAAGDRALLPPGRGGHGATLPEARKNPAPRAWRTAGSETV